MGHSPGNSEANVEIEATTRKKNEQSCQKQNKTIKQNTTWLAKENVCISRAALCMSQEAGTVDKILKAKEQEIKHKIQKEKRVRLI